MTKASHDTFKEDKGAVETLLNLQQNKDQSFDDKMLMLGVMYGNNLEKLSSTGNLWMITYQSEALQHHIIFNESFEIITLARAIIGLPGWQSSTVRILPLIEANKALEYNAEHKKVIRHTFSESGRYSDLYKNPETVISSYTGDPVDFLIASYSSIKNKNMYFYKDFVEQGLILAAYGYNSQNISTLKLYDMTTNELADTYSVVRDITDLMRYSNTVREKASLHTLMSTDKVYDAYNDKEPSVRLIIDISKKIFEAKPLKSVT